jgi:hypothetical protein
MYWFLFPIYGAVVVVVVVGATVVVVVVVPKLPTTLVNCSSCLLISHRRFASTLHPISLFPISISDYQFNLTHVVDVRPHHPSELIVTPFPVVAYTNNPVAGVAIASACAPVILGGKNPCELDSKVRIEEATFVEVPINKLPHHLPKVVLLLPITVVLLPRPIAVCPITI